MIDPDIREALKKTENKFPPIEETVVDGLISEFYEIGDNGEEVIGGGKELAIIPTTSTSTPTPITTPICKYI